MPSGMRGIGWIGIWQWAIYSADGVSVLVSRSSPDSILHTMTCRRCEPTVIITDAGGRILWVHETDNYRIRPDPDLYLAVLREHRAIAMP